MGNCFETEQEQKAANDKRYEQYCNNLNNNMGVDMLLNHDYFRKCCYSPDYYKAVANFVLNKASNEEVEIIEKKVIPMYNSQQDYYNERDFGKFLSALLHNRRYFKCQPKTRADLNNVRLLYWCIAHSAGSSVKSDRLEILEKENLLEFKTPEELNEQLKSAQWLNFYENRHQLTEAEKAFILDMLQSLIVREPVSTAVRTLYLLYNPKYERISY